MPHRSQKTDLRPCVPLIIAHRGASACAPENTIAAFSRAIDDGADGIEFDVRLAKDGVPVVHHDATLMRTARRRNRISQLTVSELENTDVGSWFGRVAADRWRSEYSNETIPTLSRVLEHLRDYPGSLYVELKAGETEDLEHLVRETCELLQRSPLKDRSIVKSFRLAFIPQVRSAYPDIRTAALFAPKVMTILRKEKHLVDLADQFGAHELSVHYSLLSKKLVKKAEKRGLPITIWTADHPRWLRRATKFGIKAVITNDPARLIAKRDLLFDS